MRYFILVCICLFVGYVGIAQEQENTENGKITVGLRAGINQSFYYVATDPDGAMRTGFVEGVYMSYSLNEKFSLQTELYYFEAGSYSATNMTGSFENPLPSSTATYDYSLMGEAALQNDYLAIPILFCFHFGDSTWKLFAGIRFGYLLRDSHSWEGELVVKDENGQNIAPNVLIDNLIYDKYEKLEFKKMDYSLSLGIHYKFKQLPLGIDLRTTYGLSDVNKNTTSEHNDWMKNGGIQFSATYDLWNNRQ
ncbi:porin family protein [Prolixibacteraceae bacterium]|nr:porin family protein [Prolixibacteraceae bacterium]